MARRPAARIVLREAGAPADEVRRDPLVVEPAVHGGEVRRAEVAKLDSEDATARLTVEAAAGDEKRQGPAQDPQVEAKPAVLHVPDVELDPLVPGDAGPSVHLCQPVIPGLASRRRRWWGVYSST